MSVYNATTGAAIAGFTSPTGLSGMLSLAITGNNLYIAYDGNGVTGSVGEYNATTGAAIAGFTSPTGLSHPAGMSLSGNNLYALNEGPNNAFVGEYNATTGATVAGFTSTQPGWSNRSISWSPVYLSPGRGRALLLACGLGWFGVTLNNPRNRAKLRSAVRACA